MKAYFNASLLGKVSYPVAYKKVISIVQELGHEMLADHIMKRDLSEVNKQSRVEHERDFQRARDEIHTSDVMIVEGTYPSIGVGRLTGLALDLHKPVLILYRTIPHGLLVGDSSRLLTVARYNVKKETELKKVIKGFLNRAKNKTFNYRFNLVIDHIQNQYLDWIASKNKKSKAEIVRSLIDREIALDPHWSKT